MSFVPNFRGLPRSFWLLWWGTLVNRAGTCVVPFLALYLTQENHLSVEQAGVVVALYGAGLMFAGPIGGWLADHIGRRQTLLLSSVLTAIIMGLLALADGFPALAALAASLGLAGDLYRPAVYALIADVIPAADRTRAFGLMHWAVNLGFSIGPLLGGLLVERGFALLFALDAATTLVFGLLPWCFDRHDERGARATPHAAGSGLSAYRDRVFAIFLAVVLVVSVLFQQVTLALPLDMRAHGLSPTSFGMVLALNGVLIALFQPTVAGYLSRFRRMSAMAGGCAVIAVGIGLTALAGSTWSYALTVAVWTFGEMAVFPISPAVVTDLAPEAMRGRYQGAFQLVIGAGALVAPLLATAVMPAAGAAALWVGCAILGLVAAAVLLALGGNPRLSA